MARLHAPSAVISKKAILEHPVRVFAFAGIQAGAEIGRYTYINRQSFVHSSVRMGRYCSVARAVDIGAKAHDMTLMSTHPFQYNKRHFDHDEGYQSFDRTISSEIVKTLIGNDVWFGAKAVISAGVTIGTGAVIGANSFVREDVPPYAIVAGTPARIIKYRFDDAIIKRLLASEWWNLKPEDMAGIPFDKIETALDEIEARKPQLKRAEANAKRKATREAKKAAELAEKEKAQKVSANAMIENLRMTLEDMSASEEIIGVVLKNASKLVEKINPLDPADQEIMRNKLEYLKDFLADKEDEGLTSFEKDHISALFRQKN